MYNNEIFSKYCSRIRLENQLLKLLYILRAPSGLFDNFREWWAQIAISNNICGESACLFCICASKKCIKHPEQIYNIPFSNRSKKLASTRAISFLSLRCLADGKQFDPSYCEIDAFCKWVLAGLPGKKWPLCDYPCLMTRRSRAICPTYKFVSSTHSHKHQSLSVILIFCSPKRLARPSFVMGGRPTC